MNLAQYYTPNPHANLLVEQMCPFIQNNDDIYGVDLGSGKGSLLYSATQTWKKANFFGVDISQSLLNAIEHFFPSVNFYCLDLLSKSSLNSNELSNQVGSRDVAVCNPPFLSFHNDSFFRKLCRATNMQDCCAMSVVTSEIVFLLHNLRLLKDGGILGIIVPDGLITGKNYQIFRQCLLSNHRVEAVIQLPDNTFHNIEVKTHVLIIRKGKGTYGKVKLMKAGALGIVGQFLVDACKLEQRMDFSFWQWKRNDAYTTSITLEMIGAAIHRGSRPRSYFANSNMKSIHTTELLATPNKVSVCKSRSSQYRMAQENDILLARVGKRCIGRAMLISRGSLPITDCVYRVRVPKEWINCVWDALISDRAKDWFLAYSHGVCAQVISKSDLLNFPICKFR